MNQACRAGQPAPRLCHLPLQWCRARHAAARAGMPSTGFTLTELVVTIAIMGILAVAVIPRLTDRLWVDARGHGDRLRAVVQYAQKIAIAQRRNVCVSFSSGTATVQMAASAGAAVACTANAIDPINGASPFVLAPPDGVTVTPSAATLSFDALGASAGTVTVSVTGAGATKVITVEGVTGHVH